MSGATTTAYRATNPEAVRESLDRYQKEYERFFEIVEEYSKKLGHKLAVVGSNEQLFARCIEDGHLLNPDDIPPGWHFYVKDREVRPYAGGRTLAAKNAVEFLRELNAESPGGLGFWLRTEFDIGAGGVFHNYGFEPVGDTYFVLAKHGGMTLTNKWEGNEHFVEVPMSSYWLAKEAEAHVAALDLDLGGDSKGGER